MRVERSWKRRIGLDFACVVIDGAELLIFVTSGHAARRAEAVRAELIHADRTTVRVVSPRYSRPRMNRIRRVMQRRVPRDSPGSFAVGSELPRGSRCPRVTLVIPPRGAADAALERWAAAAIEEFGSDRVVIDRDWIVQ